MIPGVNATKRPTAGAQLDGTPPVSWLHVLLPLGPGQLTPFKMPNNWRSKIGMTTQDAEVDSNGPQRGASPVIHEPAPVYAVCRRYMRDVELVAK
jgi:hypothetical protein